MPHLRNRFITPKILKKLKYSPVVTLQGARQTGKSFFVREILQQKIPKSKYVTFDQDSAKEFATTNIENFMAKYEGEKPLIIDEAQKVPKVFDAVKFSVDQKRIPGSFILLGSTEFSKFKLIRESLTGRISRLRFYPLTIAEAHQWEYQPSKEPFFLSKNIRLNRKNLLLHLEQGGLPGIFAIRGQEEKQQALQDWIEVTIYRDAQTFPKLKIDSELCLKILKAIASLEEPSLGNIAKTLRVDLRKIKTHATVLEILFVISKLEPHPSGTGKPIYYLLDVGIAHFLGASLQRQLETLFLQEYLAKLSFSENTKLGNTLFYYRTIHGNRLSFIESLEGSINAIQIYSHPKLTKKDFYLLTAFKEKIEKEIASKQQAQLFALVSNTHVPNPMEIHLFPWEAIG